MWILPTRGRPKQLQNFFNKYRETEASTPGMLILDQDDPYEAEYNKIELPKGWRWHTWLTEEKIPVARLYNKAFEFLPNEKWYGLISDDLIPATKYWDIKLIEEAGNDCIAHANDGVRKGSVPSCTVMGGDLVRELGHIFLPGLKHFYADDYLGEIGHRRNCLRYLPDVEVIHHHFSTGKAEFDDTYKRRDGSGDKEVYEKWLGRSLDQKIVIACVNAGNYCNRGLEYVHVLFDMVNRNIPINFTYEFHVFTDEPEGYHPSITVRELPGNLRGWWNKLYLFKRELFSDGTQVIFMDLDTVIVGGLDSLIRYRGEFATLRDFWRPEGLGPAIISWQANGKASAIWDRFEGSNFLQDMARGDQEFIENMNLNPDIFQDLYPRQFVSYKTDGQFQIPRDAKIVCFHGRPRPHEVKENWVEHIWKVGGGSTMELDFGTNVSYEDQARNIKHTMTLPHDHLDDRYMMKHEVGDEQYAEKFAFHVSIVGGGPSLADCLDEIRKRQNCGQIVWALNNSFNYLIENGIYPDAQILLDAREENAAFLPSDTKATLLLASQCHPKTFARAEKSGGKIIIWHRYIDGINKILGNKRVLVVGTGTTVGMNALGIAQGFGFKYVHLYGFDSSYRDDENHAYPQPLNNSERVIEVMVNGEKFKCAPWMAAQTNEFKACINGFIEAGMEFTIHGSGLLPYVATLLAK